MLTPEEVQAAKRGKLLYTLEPRGRLAVWGNKKGEL